MEHYNLKRMIMKKSIILLAMDWVHLQQMLNPL